VRAVERVFADELRIGIEIRRLGDLRLVRVLGALLEIMFGPESPSGKDLNRLNRM